MTVRCSICAHGQIGSCSGPTAASIPSGKGETAWMYSADFTRTGGTWRPSGDSMSRTDSFIVSTSPPSELNSVDDGPVLADPNSNQISDSARVKDAWGRI